MGHMDSWSLMGAFVFHLLGFLKGTNSKLLVPSCEDLEGLEYSWDMALPYLA